MDGSWPFWTQQPARKQWATTTMVAETSAVAVVVTTGNLEPDDGLELLT